jgi:hypothetical protein
MQDLLYGVEPNDPVTFAVLAAVLLFVALIASVLPAQRATKVSLLLEEFTRVRDPAGDRGGQGEGFAVRTP